jgi:hypothetical protein
MLFAFHILLARTCVHTSTEDKHSGSRFLDNLDQGTKVRIGGSRDTERAKPRNRLGGKLQKIESSKFSA